jgi:3-methylcrotonyl-CoA carboxylase beta subunit
VIPADVRTPYDVREVIARLVDGSEFDEFKKLYGRRWSPALPTSHGHAGGHHRQ